MAISICDVHTNQSKKDITSYGSADFPIACYEDDMQLINVPVHWHEEYEFIVATSGIVTTYVNGEHIDLKPNEAIFINSGCLHGVKSVINEPSILRSLVVLPKFIGGSVDGIIYKRLILPFSEKGAPSYIILSDNTDWQKVLIESMLSAWSAITSESFDYENEARYYVSKAMRILVDHLSEAAAPSGANEPLLNRMKIAITHIESNYSDDISNNDLMELLGCSESVLLRSFNQVVNTSPMQYLMNYRIQKAAELLISTDLKSCDIATSCGFNDISYFTKIFKRKMGVTPSKYRDTLLID